MNNENFWGKHLSEKKGVMESHGCSPDCSLGTALLIPLVDKKKNYKK